MRRRVVGVLILAALMFALVPGAPASGSAVVVPVEHMVVDGLAAAAAPGASPGLSAPVLAPRPFSLVGVSVPEGARVFLRTANAANRWSPWMEAEPLGDEGPEPGSAEATAARAGWDRMSEPVWVGDASWVQLRVGGAHTEDIAVHLVDSLGLDRSLLERVTDALRSAWRGTGSATAAASTRPPIVSRAQWGADESLRSDNPSYSHSTRAGVLHHTAGSNDYSPAQAPGVVRAIYAYHTRSLGWSDIGYNMLVDRYGTIYEGRAGGVDRGVIGAHAGGFNTETFGVSLIGTFTSGMPPQPALEAAVRTIAWKFAVHGINSDPNATVDMMSRGSTRYPQGHHARLHTLASHRDVSTTACPGDALYSHLPELRRQVHARSRPPAAPSPAEDRRLLRRLNELGLMPLSPPPEAPSAPPEADLSPAPQPPAAPAGPAQPDLSAVPPPDGLPAPPQPDARVRLGLPSPAG